MDLRRSFAFGAMRKNLRAQFESLVNLSLHKPSGIWEVAITLLRDYFVSTTSIKEPFALILLQPYGKLVPDLAYPKAFVEAAGWHFKHREGSYLGYELTFLYEGDLGAELHVDKAIRTRSLAGWRVYRTVGWR